MRRVIEMEQILAREFFVAKDGDEVYNIELQLVPHGGFDYGNGHSVVLKWNDDGIDQCFDARYDKRFWDEESFHKYSYEFVRSEVASRFSLERVEQKGEQK